MAYDADSVIGDITETPAAVEVFQHEREYHRYHEEQRGLPYVEPNNTSSIESLYLDEFCYEEFYGLAVFYDTFGCLYRSPIECPGHILEIGTGRGTWSMIIGDICPSAAVYGFDIAPVQNDWVPPSVEFSWLDCWECLNDELDNTYDLIRIGNFAGKWDILQQNLWRILKPGGYVEYCQIDIKNHYLQRIFPEDVDMELFLQESGFQSVNVLTKDIYLRKESYDVVVLNHLSNAGWSGKEFAQARDVISQYRTDGYIQYSSGFVQKAFDQPASLMYNREILYNKIFGGNLQTGL